MVDQCATGQPYTMRELEVVDLREDDLDGEAVDLRAEQPVSRVRLAVGQPWAEIWAVPFTKRSTTGCGSMRTNRPPFR